MVDDGSTDGSAAAAAERAVAMTGSPSVAVCVVTYESEHVIGKCLRRLRGAATASSVDCSVTVVDNGSRDHSVKLAVEAWPDARVIELGENRGYARAANEGVHDAKADWLLFLNPDAVVGPDLFSFLQAVHTIGEVAAFSPVFTDERGEPARTAYRWPTVGKEVARLSGVEALLKAARILRPDRAPIRTRVRFPEPVGVGWRVDYAAGACLFIRRGAWDRIGPFDERFFLYHEEMEWSLRAARHGLSMYVFPACRVIHVGGQSAPKARRLVWRYAGLLDFYEKHGSPGRRAVLRAALAASFGVRAAAAAIAGKEADQYREVARMAVSRR